MALTPSYHQLIRIFAATVRALHPQRLFKLLRGVSMLLFRLLLRALQRCTASLKAQVDRSRRPKPGLPDMPSPIQSDLLAYTAVHNGCIITLGSIATSLHPESFDMDNILSSYKPALPDSGASRSTSPNHRQTPSESTQYRASTSNFPYSTAQCSVEPSYSPYSSMGENLTHGADGTQVERRDIATLTRGARNSQRTDSELPDMSVEGADSPTTEKSTPLSTIEEERDSVWTPRPSLDRNPNFLDIPGGSAASAHTQVSASNSDITSGAWDDGWDLMPTFPAESLRYQRRTKILKKPTNIIMEPLQLEFDEYKTPDGWIKYDHPEGCAYYYNNEKRIYTDAELHDPAQLQRIEEKIKQVKLAKDAFDFPLNADIVLNLYGTGEEQNERQYFCLDHDRRIIFFFHPFEAAWTATWGEVKGAFSQNQWRYELESQYWYAVQMYPHPQKLSKDTVDELRDIVTYLIGDTMSSSYSTSIFSPDDLQKILSITSNVKDNIETQHTAGCLCIVARFMFLLYHVRFLNFHGESYARIERNFSVYGHALSTRSTSFRVLSLLLFFTPDEYLTTMQDLWVDEVLHVAMWQQTMNLFSSQWQNLVTAAAILLNASIAFLAIQSVDKPPSERSWAQVISYASVVTNVAGMLSGLFLVRKYGDSGPGLEKLHRFLYHLRENHSSLEILAITFGLPYALLMWGALSFFAAFALMCLDLRAKVDTRVIIGVCLALACFLIFWTVLSGRERVTKPDPLADNRSAAYRMPQPPDQSQDTVHSTTTVDAVSIHSATTVESIHSVRVTAFSWVRRFTSRFSMGPAQLRNPIGPDVELLPR